VVKQSKQDLGKEDGVIDETTGLTLRQLRAVPVVASNPSLYKACKILGISSQDMAIWANIPAFRKCVENLRTRFVEEAVGTLKASCTEAVEVLVSLMRKSDSENIKRCCANDILNHLSRYLEMSEISQRVTELELAACNIKGVDIKSLIPTPTGTTFQVMPYRLSDKNRKDTRNIADSGISRYDMNSVEKPERFNTQMHRLKKEELANLNSSPLDDL
jgi:hypothetical protein